MTQGKLSPRLKTTCHSHGSRRRGCAKLLAAPELGSWGTTYQPLLSYENGDIILLPWIPHWVIVKLPSEILGIKFINKEYKPYVCILSYAEKRKLLAWLASCGGIPLLSSRTFKWCTHVTICFVLKYKDFVIAGSPLLPRRACSSHPALWANLWSHNHGVSEHTCHYGFFFIQNYIREWHHEQLQIQQQINNWWIHKNNGK